MFMPSRLVLRLAILSVLGAGLSGMPSPASADPTRFVSIAPVERTKLILLGTAAGPVPKATRSQPATAIVVDGKVYLFDVGNGVLRQLAKAGYGVSDVETIFITHNHFDHNADLGSVMAFRWMAGGGKPVPIIGPPGTAAVAAAHLRAFRHSEEIFAAVVPGRKLPKLHTEFPVRERMEGLVFSDERITVTAVENSHYSMQYKSAAAYGRDHSISYRIQTPDRVIVITGDTGKSDALEALAKDADILVSEVLDVDAIEAYVAKRAAAENWSDKQKQDTLRHHMRGHLPARDLGVMAAAAKVKSIVLTHFVPTSPTSLDTSVVEGQVREAYDGTVVGGVDLQVF